MRVALVMACAVVLVAGCSASEAGTPVPGDPPSATPDNSETDEPTDPLADVGQCDLLATDDLAEIGLETGEPLGDEGCDYRRSSGSGVLLSLLVGHSPDAFTAGGTRIDIGEFDAYLQENPAGGQGACRIVLVTSENSFVLVSATDGADTAAACDLATNVTKRIDSGLS